MADVTVSGRSPARPGRDASAYLLGCDRRLAAAYDVALLDLDGVCFSGRSHVPYAAESVSAARASGMRLSYVTNNASRAPQAVVDKLAAHGIEAEVSEVFSAAMDAAAMLGEHVPQGSTVLVVGGEGVRQALVASGYVTTGTAEDDPAAVVQGWDPAVDWAMLSEAVYAVCRGALHVATNLDATLPTERGFAIGNGSLVAAVVNATGEEPLVAGKPFPGIYQRALQRSGGSSPLAVGDRLNTDLTGARSAGIPGLHVLTGVSAARDVVLCAPAERPSFLHTDLRGLVQAHPWPLPRVSGGVTWWQVGSQCACVRSGRLELDGSGVLGGGTVRVGLDAYRALVAAAWDWVDSQGVDGGSGPEELQVPGLDVVA